MFTEYKLSYDDIKKVAHEMAMAITLSKPIIDSDKMVSSYITKYASLINEFEKQINIKI